MRGKQYGDFMRALFKRVARAGSDMVVQNVPRCGKMGKRLWEVVGDMRYANIAGIERQASVICMGTASMGSVQSRDDAFAILDRYAELGGNFLDTARIYGQDEDGVSHSERCVGEWLRTRGMRGKIVLATKGAHHNIKDKSRRLSREDILSDCQSSLRDLGVDFIDLYWLHRDDETRPVEEIVDTLNLLKRRGWVGALGASNWSARRIAAANAYAAASGQTGFTADQPQWSLARQAVCHDETLVQMNAELMAMHARTGMAVVPFSSQAKGFYSKLAEGGIETLNDTVRTRFAVEDNLRKLPIVERIAREHDVSVGAVALGYLTSHSFPAFPIVGISRIEYMKDVEQAGNLALLPEEVEALSRA